MQRVPCIAFGETRFIVVSCLLVPWCAVHCAVLYILHTDQLASAHCTLHSEHCTLQCSLQSTALQHTAANLIPPVSELAGVSELFLGQPDLFGEAASLPLLAGPGPVLDSSYLLIQISSNQ